MRSSGRLMDDIGAIGRYDICVSTMSRECYRGYKLEAKLGWLVASWHTEYANPRLNHAQISYWRLVFRRCANNPRPQTECRKLNWPEWGIESDSPIP